MIEESTDSVYKDVLVVVFVCVNFFVPTQCMRKRVPQWRQCARRENALHTSRLRGESV
jgi:hypothetical protein